MVAYIGQSVAKMETHQPRLRYFSGPFFFLVDMVVLEKLSKQGRLGGV